MLQKLIKQVKQQQPHPHKHTFCLWLHNKITLYDYRQWLFLYDFFEATHSFFYRIQCVIFRKTQHQKSDAFGMAFADDDERNTNSENIDKKSIVFNKLAIHFAWETFIANFMCTFGGKACCSAYSRKCAVKTMLVLSVPYMKYEMLVRYLFGSFSSCFSLTCNAIIYYFYFYPFPSS